jgi:DNA repair exonuclease SbcCD ATPase subunit
VKQLIIKLLASLGLVTAGRYGVAVARLREAESHAKKLTKAVEASKAEARTLKVKADDLTQRLKTLEKDDVKRARDAERLKLEVEKRGEGQQREAARLVAEIERLKKQNLALESLRTRLEETERSLGLAREHLMAIDVKLDILEGAANVLDARTRGVVAQQAGQTNAPV